MLNSASVAGRTSFLPPDSNNMIEKVRLLFPFYR